MVFKVNLIHYNYKKRLSFIILVALLIFLQTTLSQAQPTIELTEIASGFSTPVDIAHTGDDRLFVVEQTGRIRVIDGNQQIQSMPFLNITNKIRFGGERGLLGLAFHPDFSTNGFFYVNYTNTAGNTHIARFQVAAGATVADPDSELILLTIDQPFPNHNGGALKFGPDGFLYIGLGDGGFAGDPINAGQDNQVLLGKMLRIDVDNDANGLPYAVPADNPFVNSPNFRAEIWASGLRNPWRFSFDQLTGDLWIADVGQDRQEEINFIPSSEPGGLDFGWRCYEGDNLFNPTGCADESTFYFPVHTYATTPSVGESVTGGYVYRGTQNTDLVGQYIYGDFVSGRIWALELVDNEASNTEILNIGMNEISTFGEDATGELYLAAYSSGTIYQIQQPIISSVEEKLEAGAITIYPNPSQETLLVKLEAANNLPNKLTIINTNGQIVYEHPSRIEEITSIDISDLNAGVYYLLLETKFGLISHKVVKIGK